VLAFGYCGALVTPLEEIIIEMIEAEGPIALDRYMALCLGHPVHGYYMSRDPFGAAGDFTTAPEISQVFGELIGVWCVNAWAALGSPAQFALVELGPGRGTLMADLLRAAKGAPEFGAAAQVHLVETSPVLRAAQKAKLSGDVTWHHSVETLPDLPLIIIANEFFDALPIRQFERRDGKNYEWAVGLQEGALKLGLAPTDRRLDSEGLFEVSFASMAIAEDLGAHLNKSGGAALVIDYGHLKSAAGDTLQALCNHAFCGILENPGEADLTAHVDFEALGRSFDAQVLPMLTQGQFLQRMGIDLRTEKLAAKLQNEARQDFNAGAHRLIAAEQMGDLFKVMCVVQKGAAPIYPFEVS
jgi:NADH dehydrogenase [ubiquinone] 1 alpha subcomplex assembly factor 7